ncbi:MAG TPA: TIGR03086 family metal-binding protein [Acidimicrobiales bacterium]|nr:TIGR03086 family metal-binding protein [Acidimicrobiales bacterium]
MGSLEDLQQAGSAFGELVAGTSAAQLAAATPCSEWDVRALLNHVVTGTQWFTTMLRAEPAPDRSVDQLGEDPAAAYRAALGEFVGALGEPGALEASYEGHRLGAVSGARLAAMRTNEYMVHGWDLANATGQSAAVLPEALVPGCIALYEEMLAGRPREPGGAFGVPVELAADAPPLDRLAAFFGRTPR